MSYEELRALIGYVGTFGLGSAITLVVVGVLFKSYLFTYLAKKGENLATKEDVAAITHEVERVRTQYTVLVEDTKAKHQLRMSALDRRLQAHQEAFAHWRELMGATHTEDIGAAVVKCQAWWEQNCLYLEPKVREAFVTAYSAANSHNSYVEMRADAQFIKENWKRITEFPNLVFEAVQLPPLSESEAIAIAKPLGRGFPAIR